MSPSRIALSSELHCDNFSSRRHGRLWGAARVILLFGWLAGVPMLSGCARVGPVLPVREAPVVADAPAAPPPDKSMYWLGNPTPRELMRELVTDRPDRTEAAITVDAGHFQVEADLLAYTFDRRKPEGGRVDDHAFQFALSNLKVGLTNSTDLQVVVEPATFTISRDRDARTSDRRFGFGDVVVRLKQNLWGNDGGTPFAGTALGETLLGTSSFGVMPYISIPAGTPGFSSNGIEGGIIVPFGMDLPAGFGLGAMVQFDFVRNETGSGRHAEFVQSITLSRGLTEAVSAYVEFWNCHSARRGRPWTATVDFGVTWAVTPDVQLDAGINIGVTRATEDFMPFLGITVRH